MKPPHPKDVITNTLLRAKGSAAAQQMIAEFTHLTGDEKALFLFCTLQDLAAEMNRLQYANQTLKASIDKLTKGP